MILLIIFAIFVALAFWTRSTFINIMAGLVSISVGVERIAQSPGDWIYLITGAAIVATGLYLLIMVGVDLLKGN
jgi:hypothetical protein